MEDRRAKSPAVIVDEDAKVDTGEEKDGTPKPTDYQKKLIAAWYESGHRGPAPFASDGTQLIWMNRHARRARAKQARKGRG